MAITCHKWQFDATELPSWRESSLGRCPPGFDPDCFVEHWLAGGGPASFTVRADKVIGEDSSNPNLANGVGLEHIEEAYGALFGASLQACAL